MAEELKRLERRAGALSGQEDLRTALDLLEQAAEIMGRNEEAGLSIADERQWLADYNAAKGE